MAHEKMKKKKQVKKLYENPKIRFVLAFFIFLSLIYLLMLGDESHFKIMKNGVEVDEAYLDNFGGCNAWVNNECVHNGTYISKQSLTIEWLDKHCECQEKVCTISYNYSQMKKATMNNSGEFISQTYNGPIGYTEGGSIIFFEPGAQVVEQCGSCKKYQCGDYNVEVWNQIK